MGSVDTKNFSELYGIEYKRGMMTAINRLAALGKDAIQWAQQRREYKHRTYNLYESYASAVYLNGNIVEKSIKQLSGPRAEKPIRRVGKTGEELALEYLRNQHPKHTLALICVAAAPYAQYLEEGAYGGPRIEVISAAQDVIDRRWKSELERISPLFKNISASLIGGNANYGTY